MKKTSVALAALIVAGSMSTAFAGGPIVVKEEPKLVPVLAPVSSLGGGAAIGIAAAVAVIAAAAAGGGGGSTTTTTGAGS